MIGLDTEKVSLDCTCGTSFQVTRDVLRESIDTNSKLTCAGCYFNAIAKFKKETAIDKQSAQLQILYAMCELGIDEIKVPDIVIVAWKRFPNKFGLKTYENSHPNSNRVIAELVRMTNAGLIERTSQSTYTITTTGKNLMANYRD